MYTAHAGSCAFAFNMPNFPRFPCRQLIAYKVMSTSGLVQSAAMGSGRWSLWLDDNASEVGAVISSPFTGSGTLADCLDACNVEGSCAAARVAGYNAATGAVTGGCTLNRGTVDMNSPVRSLLRSSINMSSAV
jgi:hypothetical protein